MVTISMVRKHEHKPVHYLPDSSTLKHTQSSTCAHAINRGEGARVHAINRGAISSPRNKFRTHYDLSLTRAL